MSAPVERDQVEGLVARAEQLRELRDLLAAGRPALVLGEAGVGKTSLARAAAGEAAREGGALATVRWAPHLALRRALPGLPSDGEPLVVAGQVRSRLRGATLVLEDLQWADEGTLAVTELLAGRVPLVATVRDDEPLGHEVADRLLAAGLVPVRVPPLSGADARRLVARLRPEISPHAAGQLVARAGGNPLAIAELAAAHPRVPATFRLAVADRVAELAAGPREDLVVLAVAGRPLPRDWFDPARLASLQAAALVVLDDGEVAVRHDLLAEVAVENADEGVRRRAHARVAALEPAPGVRARHLQAAGDLVGARTAALSAAAVSTTPGERAEHLVLAAACGQGPASDDLRLEAAAALEQANDWDRLEQVLAPLATTDPQLRARAELLRARTAWTAGRPDVVRAALERGLALVAGSGSPTEVLLRIEACRIPVFVDGDAERGVAAGREALALAESAGVGIERAHYLLGTALGVCGQDGWEQHLLAAAEVAATTPGAGDTELRSLNNLVTFHESSGSPATARELAARAVARAEELGLLGWAAILRAMGAHLDMHAGAWAAAADEAERLLALPLDQRATDTLHQTRGMALVDLGRLDEAEAEVRAHLDRAADDSRGRSSLLIVLAEAALWGGRPREALELAEEYVAGLEDDPANQPFGVVVAAWARLELDLPVGPPPQVPGWAVLAAVPPEVEAVAALQAGRPEEALPLFDQAAQAWAPYHRRGELRCAWGAGEAARRAGDLTDAVRRLEQLEPRLLELGALPLLGRVHRSLRACGRARRAVGARAGSGQRLSTREAQVLRLAGAGLTTPEIAARLGIGRRAVAEHIRSAVLALGATGRAQAVAMLDAEDAASGEG